MNKIISVFKAFVTDENAVTSIEYALMAALLASVIVIGIGVVSDGLTAVFTAIGTKIGSTTV
ncbi:MAG: Flp family type IVb pilin [Massilia sp.]|nr:Flp family type IVb pilin [Massilia sp.]